MNSLNRKDIEKMTKDNELTDLKLHLQGDNVEPENLHAYEIKELVEDLAKEQFDAESERGLSLVKHINEIYSIACICTKKDYQTGQKNQDWHFLFLMQPQLYQPQ